MSVWSASHCKRAGLPLLYRSSVAFFLFLVPLVEQRIVTVAVATDPSAIFRSNLQQSNAERKFHLSSNHRSRHGRLVDANDNATETTMEETIGGGEVNERTRTNTRVTTKDASTSNGTSPILTKSFDPVVNRAHLFHAVEGLYRYPNYLSRWSESDVDRLESALLDQLTLVRKQRDTIRTKRQATDSLVQKLLGQDTSGRWNALLTPPTSWQRVKNSILDPAASRAFFGSKNERSDWPSFHEVTRQAYHLELPVGPLAGLMDEELPDVFTFPLLAPSFCAEICAYVQALASMDSDFGRRVVNLDTVGLSWVNDLLLALVMRPIARHLFTTTDLGNGDLDWRNGYIAGYAAVPTADHATRRERLVTHTDDSEVTLNICLGEEGFTGGLLDFRGLRGTKDQSELLGTYQPVVGKAVFHAGRHFHDVTPITSGNRFALIVWARSWTGVRSKECPCCWLNRRRDDQPLGSCICGRQWN